MRKFLYNISTVAFGNFFNAALGFFYIAAVAKALTLEDFGKYSILSATLVGIAKLTDFGVNNVFVAKSITQTDAIEKLRHQFGGAKITLLVLAIFIGCLFIFSAGYREYSLLILFIIGVVGYSVNFSLFALFQKEKLYIYAVALNTLPALIKGLIAIMLFFGFFNLSLFSAFAVFSLSICTSLILYTKLPEKHTLYSFPSKKTFELLRTAAPAGVSGLIGSSWSAIAAFIAKVFGTFSSAGIYSIADKIANVFTLVSVSISTVLLPNLAQSKLDNKRINKKKLGVLCILTATMGLLTVGATRVLFPIVFGDKFADSINLLDILIIAASFTAIHNFLENYFFVEQATHKLAAISLLKLTVFVAVAFSLMGTYGLTGLAIAQISASTVALITISVFIYR
ncbi:oligosaccharide flippase family protein [Candidatus Nomurabacteria bacterium]|uniref:Oligosaccharide flippase family protein n=1 Tax=candidate division WWE3 bacterium TaxID=2053526 RepID=A0A955IVW8_UNCKA|nr:oligosaccharide flippase family protein [candidate division WWE3 bacterium]MCB9824130.1 oligosaccharide flippase family protein [Candidatus Nomurabacteria bacterium]MCB9826899.1 oligosaccharide flippase family protein [Candidatus Nomurabacteria bacterium]MCB9828071.1 oligosaccharide flippase family protein [Candidatus Nomurabacteria bacterium]HXK52895.1 oligosaccharide flippase family protein [bacterium]